LNGELISLKDNDWLKRQLIAGKVLSSIHREIFGLMKGTATNLYLSDLDAIAKNTILQSNCTPTFYKYKGFPSTICTSLNKELVHGFSNRKIRLEQGDVLKVDIGVTFEGAIADCAFTYIYGKVKSQDHIKLLISCQDSLNSSISLLKPGVKIGVIGNSIFKKGSDDGFGVITDYGGHGLDYNTLHTTPFIPNKSREDECIIVQPGLAIAIEPMFVLGKNTRTRVMADKWTVMTADIGAHFEHSVTFDQDGNKHIITDHKLSAKDFI
jgi:methionyl aminopeptidase